MLYYQVVIVGIVALAAGWLVRSIGELRTEDAGRREKLDVEAAAILLVLALSGIAISANVTIQIAGGVALVVGLGAGWWIARRRRR